MSSAPYAFEDLAFSSYGHEHVILESGGDEHDGVQEPFGDIQQEFELLNLGPGTRVKLTIYGGGYIDVVTRRPGTRLSRRWLNLRYIDSRPHISRFTARGMLRFALGSISVGAISGMLAWLNVRFAIPVTFAAIASALLFAVLFACRTGERCVFYTAHGRAEVLTLTATLGSVRRLRRTVPSLVAIIRQSHPLREPDANQFLRAEMREHYRLSRGGVLDDDEFARCTRRILGAFNRQRLLT